MKVSVRTAYAIHGLGCIGALGGDGPVEFKAIWEIISYFAHDNRLSEGYAAKLFRDLVRAGLVTSVPGAKGGYSLTRPPEQITFLDVLEAVDGAHWVSHCLLSRTACTRQERCTVYQSLNSAAEEMRRQMSRFHVGMVSDEIRGELG